MPDEPKTDPGSASAPGASAGRRPRVWRRVRRGVGLLLLVLLAWALAAAPRGWLPRLANALTREYLGSRGLSAIRVNVERLTPWHLRAAVQTGTNGPASQLDCVELRFSPSGLWRHRIDSVSVAGGLVQLRAGTNGVALCGLPPDLRRLAPGKSPLADDDAAAPKAWQVGQVLVDGVTLRLLAPDTNEPPFDVSLHASAMTDELGDIRFSFADYGRAGTLANGEFRPDTGDGWIVAVLPESQVQEWLRVAQWLVTDPRFRTGDLCAGNGGATLLARMEKWRPALAQADLSLRAASLLGDLSLAYDLRLHGVAQWEHADNLKPTVSASAEISVRMAACPAFYWCDDREVPATASIAVKLTPKRAEWGCLVAARAVLSHEAAQACVPAGVVQLAEAPLLRVDASFTSPDLALWDGEANAMLLLARPRLTPGHASVICSDLVVNATAAFTNSRLAGVRGWMDAAGVAVAAGDARCAGEAGAAFRVAPPFREVALAVTTRVLTATLPSGMVDFDPEHPLDISARLRLPPLAWSNAVPEEVRVAPWRAKVAGAEFGMPRGFDATFCGGSLRDGTRISRSDPAPVFWRTEDGLRAAASLQLAGGHNDRDYAGFHSDTHLEASLTGVSFSTPSTTGGMSRLELDFSAHPDQVSTTATVLALAIGIDNASLRHARGVRIEGVSADLGLAFAKRGFRKIGRESLTWSNVEYRGVHLLPEGFAIAVTDQTATADFKVGVPEADLHAELSAYADWSHAWQVAVTAEVPPTTLADTAALRGAIRRLAGAEMSVTGQVSATVSAWLEEDRDPRVNVAAAVGNLDIGCPANDWQMTGLSAGFTADGPRGWRTPPGQALTFDSARSGDFAFESGSLRWQYRRDALLLEQADINWCGGSLHAFGVPYYPRERRLETVLYAERIELGRLMAQTRVLQGTGEGRLFGRIPLKVDHGIAELTESYLYSMPGEAGILKIANTAPLDAALERGSVDDETRRQVRASLQNLRYTLFRMDLSGRGTNATLGVQIKGRSADNPALRPVDLNVNLNGAMNEIFNFGAKAASALR